MSDINLTIDSDDLKWIVAALENARDTVAQGITQQGEDFSTDEAFLAYRRLAEKFDAVDDGDDE